MSKKGNNNLYIENSPSIATTLNKMIRGKKKPEGTTVESELQNAFNQLDLQKLSDTQVSYSNAYKDLRQVLPQIERAGTVFVSAVLSPHDLSVPELIVNVKDTFEHPLSDRMRDVVDDHLKLDYKIDGQLFRIAHDVLFAHGSHVKMVVPDSEITRLVDREEQISFEDAKEVIDVNWSTPKVNGFLGRGKERNKSEEARSLPDTPSLESYFNHTDDTSSGLGQTDVEKRFNLEFSDDYDSLMVPLLHERVRSNFALNKIGKTKNQISMEAARLKKSEIESEVKEYEEAPAAFIKDPSHITVQEGDVATTINLPSGSVIPLISPGDPSNHIGYIVLTDSVGYPITKTNEDSFIDSLSKKKTVPKEYELLDRLTKEWKGVDYEEMLGESKKDVNHQIEQYGYVIEEMILERMRNGVFGDTASVAERTDIYRVMFARSLQGRKTKMVFVPRELVTYFAYEYGDNGVGRSLVHNVMVMASMRAALLFADVRNQMLNSIGRTRVNIEHDPDEVDPEKTRSMVADQLLRARSNLIDFNNFNPNRIESRLSNMGIEIVSTGHKMLPETRIEIEDLTRDLPSVDRDLIEVLDKYIYMGLLLSSDLMDEIEGQQLATSIIRRDLMLAKSVLTIQMMLCEKLTHHLSVYISYTGTVINQLHKILDEVPKAERKSWGEKYKDADNHVIVEDFINSLEFTLPKPDTTSEESQLEAMENHERLIDEALKHWISADLFDMDNSGAVERVISSITYHIKSQYMRRWMRQNNIATELSDIIDFETDVNLKKGEIKQSPFIAEMFEFIDKMLDFGNSYAAWAEIGDEKREKIKDMFTSMVNERIAKDLEKRGSEDPEMGDGGSNSDEETSDVSSGTEEPESGDVEGEEPGSSDDELEF